MTGARRAATVVRPAPSPSNVTIPLAALRCVHLLSPQPDVLAAFYARTYGMALSRTGDVRHCRAQGRHVAVSAGPPNRLRYALFACAPSGWDAMRARLDRLPAVAPPPGCGLSPQARAAADPDGNLMVFEPGPARTQEPSPAGAEGVADLQHLALRTQQLPTMLRFYRDALGFVLSDEVVDDAGTMRAAFLRTSVLHHALALFAAPVACFDHQSFETADWTSLQRWADRMADLREVIVWGVGRHGPGNDVFFMVRDPDGNLAEISAEIEVCAPDRPPGRWAHEERTLNLWGKAILRS